MNDYGRIGNNTQPQRPHAEVQADSTKSTPIAPTSRFASIADTIRSAPSKLANAISRLLSSSFKNIFTRTASAPTAQPSTKLGLSDAATGTARKIIQNALSDLGNSAEAGRDLKLKTPKGDLTIKIPAAFIRDALRTPLFLEAVNGQKTKVLESGMGTNSTGQSAVQQEKINESRVDRIVMQLAEHVNFDQAILERLLVTLNQDAFTVLNAPLNAMASRLPGQLETGQVENRYVVGPLHNDSVTLSAKSDRKFDSLLLSDGSRMPCQQGQLSLDLACIIKADSSKLLDADMQLQAALPTGTAIKDEPPLEMVMKLNPKDVETQKTLLQERLETSFKALETPPSRVQGDATPPSFQLETIGGIEVEVASNFDADRARILINREVLKGDRAAILARLLEHVDNNPAVFKQLVATLHQGTLTTAAGPCDEMLGVGTVAQQYSRAETVALKLQPTFTIGLFEHETVSVSCAQSKRLAGVFETSRGAEPDFVDPEKSTSKLNFYLLVSADKVSVRDLSYTVSTTTKSPETLRV